ncbi:ATP-binding cassette domain-containing protein [Novosphingobium sp. M1R2S20]|uniref:ATP-binding cassette domain-containing protein n=1 Tax=Novosphingobium rhizovicinum TaxID=3228928 RepID=A0ABV3R964_9SPHN
MIRIEQARLEANGRTLVYDIDLTIRRGETTVLIGPNGAGKSSLVRLVSGATRPTSGRVLIDNTPIANIGPRQLALRRAVLSQTHDGGEGFTVDELVRLGLRLTVGRASPLVQRAWIDDALGDVALQGWGNRIVGTLSGGERQRAHFARVLVQLRAGADGDRLAHCFSMSRSPRKIPRSSSASSTWRRPMRQPPARCCWFCMISIGQRALRRGSSRSNRAALLQMVRRKPY